MTKLTDECVRMVVSGGLGKYMENVYPSGGLIEYAVIPCDTFVVEIDDGEVNIYFGIRELENKLFKIGPYYLPKMSNLAVASTNEAKIEVRIPISPLALKVAKLRSENVEVHLDKAEGLTREEVEKIFLEKLEGDENEQANES